VYLANGVLSGASASVKRAVLSTLTSQQQRILRIAQRAAVTQQQVVTSVVCTNHKHCARSDNLSNCLSYCVLLVTAITRYRSRSCHGSSSINNACIVSSSYSTYGDCMLLGLVMRAVITCLPALYVRIDTPLYWLVFDCLTALLPPPLLLRLL
jgi:hypothetical protein